MARARFYASQYEPNGATLPHLCEADGCSAVGEFRAPRSRRELSHYYWFCLDHVREYNRAWDYYAGMSEAEIEANIRFDITWQRPTWPLGKVAAGSPSFDPEDIVNSAGFFHRNAEETRQERARARPRTEQEQALALFELDNSATQKQIKARYKQLVKRHHPDANGGDKNAEEKLKEVNQAYAVLRERPPMPLHAGA